MDWQLLLPGNTFLLGWVGLLFFTVLAEFAYRWVAGVASLRPDDADLEEPKQEISILRTLLWAALGLSLLSVPLVKGIDALGWSAHVLGWLHLVLRWAHIIIGIAWIGASFYFTFLENALNRTFQLRDELAGDLWAVHGGGFYYLEKYKGAPKKLPFKLHWFKYEAYFTWVTGIGLLWMVYYMNAASVMVDPAVSDMSPTQAVGLGVLSLVGGWLLYHGLCATPLLKKKTLFALLGFAIVTGISYLLSQYLSGRAAFMHVGALLGTIMAGNVFFVIIPAQKALVKAAKLGVPLDLERGKIAGLRSLHNNYITFPVLFVMISNHYPTTFGHEWNWVVLAILTLGSVAIKHFINLHERGKTPWYLVGLGIASLVALVILTAPKSLDAKALSGELTYADIDPIIKKHCVSCHAAKPTDPNYPEAPAGAMYDTPDQVRKLSAKIMERAVHTKSMPQGNTTGMTDEERQLLGAWIQSGMR